MITPSFALTATERVLPKLALDFTTASLDSRVTFTRTTSASNPATYTDSSGVIAAATNNQPRFDHDPITLACKGLLIEESRTNLLVRSEEFQTTWSPVNSSISVDQITAPDGTSTADKLVEDNSNAQHRIDQTPTSSAGVQTFSVFAKKAERSFMFLRIGLNGACFSLEDGTVSNISAGVTASTQAFNNGWYRCLVTYNAAANDICRINVQPIAQVAWGYLGDGTSGIYIWGAQLEAGAFATSYIPTTTAALTRNADVATMTGTNFSDWYNASEGTFVAWGTQQSEDQAGGQRRGFANISDGTNNNRIGMSPVQFAVVTLGSSVVNQTYASFVANQNYKIACAYKLNNSQSASNAILSSNDTSCAIPTVNQLRFGIFRASDGLMCGYLQKFFYYPQRLIGSEVQAISK